MNIDHLFWLRTGLIANAVCEWRSWLACQAAYMLAIHACFFHGSTRDVERKAREKEWAESSSVFVYCAADDRMTIALC